MELTEENVDDLVNQWWFTNSNNNTDPNGAGIMNAGPNPNDDSTALSSANSPIINSPPSSTSLENNFEGLCEFPFFSSTEALQSPRSPRYECIAIAAPSGQTEPNTPLTDVASMGSASIKQEPPVSPLLPPVVQTRGPGRPRKNAASLRVETANSGADHTSKRKRHSQIERRYRCRLQAGMDSLGEVLPSRVSNRDRDGGDSPSAAAAGPRSRKASILIDAREYILELEADKRLLAAENNSLKAEIARMKRQRVKETSYYAS